VRLVLNDAGRQLVLGISLGVLFGIAAARLARAMLFDVKPSDPATIAVVVATLAVTGLAASLVPAQRATKSDPVRSLRSE